MRAISVVVVLLSAASASPAQAGNKDFSAEFDNCAEYVGIGPVPAANVRPLVPSQYVLQEDAGNVQLVVRVTNCANVSVDGKKSGPARTAQIGVMLASGDPSANINNYLLWFVTNSGSLHGKLQAAGIKNGNDQQLEFVLDPISEDGGTLTINVDAPDFPAFPLFGSVGEPSPMARDFVANWYADSNHGALVMQTSFHELRFGGSDIVLTAPPHSQLAKLIGGTSLSFPTLDSYNEWSSALMQATLQ